MGSSLHLPVSCRILMQLQSVCSTVLRMTLLRAAANGYRETEHTRFFYCDPCMPCVIIEVMSNTKIKQDERE